MANPITAPLIARERINALLQHEPAVLILGLVVTSWFIYKFLLTEVAAHRHSNLRLAFRNLFSHAFTFTLLYIAHALIEHFIERAPHPSLERFAPYFGLIVLFSGATVFIKTARIVVFEYLFLGHMKEGVPVLLVNIFTLFLSVVIGGWLLSDLFNIRLAPLLATSAFFSIVLGMALQDTLGNLFAAIALQFDKPYEIGDWIEITTGPQRWVGQVHEITWRATVLIGLYDEIRTIPNRIIGSAEVSNFSPKNRPIFRTQVLRIDYTSDLDLVKKNLLASLLDCQGVLKTPAPLVLFSESQESWVQVKLTYAIEDYGSQWRIGDQVIANALKELHRSGVSTAIPKVEWSSRHPFSADEKQS